MNALQHAVLNFKSNSIKVYCFQIFIVLSGTTLGLFYWGDPQLIVPVTLGAIAAALTDFDDRLSIRLRNLLLVCILFFTVSSILELLHFSSLLLILYLSVSSVALMLLGALGQRYATISFGTVLLSIYTLFGLGEYPHWYSQSSYFVYGALWYGLTSIIFYLLKPTQAVQDQLAITFQHIAQLLRLKAELFDPDHHEKVENILYELSLQNSSVVQQLNLVKATLLTRLKASRANKNTIYWLHLYFLAQDIHEQVTSNYLHYENIADNFSRTDLIYRFQKNIQNQSIDCEKLADHILKLQIFQPAQSHQIKLKQLETSLQEWIERNPDNIEVTNLSLIFNNMQNIQDQLLNLSQQQHNFKHSVAQSTHQHHDNLNLLDEDIQGFTDLWLKVKQHLSPQSALFRHAIRIGFIFAVGSLISLLPFAKNGYWILLTGLFVCQMSYFATKSRLQLRTLGTLLGVVIGLPILYFVPSIEGQLLLTILFGVAFFYLRSKKYAMATLMATLVVLLIFNLKGAGYSIIFPRIIDTLIGCGLAWFAVNFIWPDWDFRNISNTILKSRLAMLKYFEAVILQYQEGRDNSMEYRIARRNAHNAHTELSTMISSLSTEPQPDRTLVHFAFRYLVYSHSQLSYISALGSHRDQIKDSDILTRMQQIIQLLGEVQFDDYYLSRIQVQLDEINQLQKNILHSDDERLILKQLSLLLETLPELTELRQELLRAEIQ